MVAQIIEHILLYDKTNVFFSDVILIQSRPFFLLELMDLSTVKH